MPDGYLVTAETIRKLRADHEELRTALKVLQNTVLRMPMTSIGGSAETMAIARVAEVIDGYTVNADGNTVLDFGPADIHRLEADGELVSLERAVDVWNVEETAVGVDEFVNITRNFLTGKWIIDQIGGPTVGLHRVKLKESMGITTPGQADADLYTLAGVDTGTDVTVLDPDNLYPSALGPRVSPVDPLVTLDGAAGLVTKSGSDYYAVELEQAARFIRFEVDSLSGYLTTDEVWEVAVGDWWHGQRPGATSDRDATGFYAYNFAIQQTAAAGTEHLFEGGSGAVGLAVWNDRATASAAGAEVTHPGLYTIIQMEFECPE